MSKRIENPWAVYIDGVPIGVGLISQEEGNTVDILYAEKQQYPAQCWTKKNVQRFSNYSQAIDYYLEHGGDSPREKLEEWIKRDFQDTIAQSSPKLIDQVLEAEKISVRQYKKGLKSLRASFKSKSNKPSYYNGFFGVPVFSEENLRG